MLPEVIDSLNKIILAVHSAWEFFLAWWWLPLPFILWKPFSFLWLWWRTDGFLKKLEINGVGFKATVQGDKLILNVGYSHPVEYQIPKGIDIKVEKNIVTPSFLFKSLM